MSEQEFIEHVDADAKPSKKYTKARVITKFVLGHAAAIGAGLIVGAVVKQAFAGQEIKLPKKLVIVVGSFALGGVAAVLAKDGIDEQIDDWFDYAQNIHEGYNEMMEQYNSAQGAVTTN